MTNTDSDGSDLSALDLLVAIAESWRLLFIVPILAASLAYAYVWSTADLLVSDMVIGVDSKSMPAFDGAALLGTDGANGQFLSRVEVEALKRSTTIEPIREGVSRLTLSLPEPAEPRSLLGKLARYFEQEAEEGRLQLTRNLIVSEQENLGSRTAEINIAIDEFQWALAKIRQADTFLGADYLAIYNKLEGLHNELLEIERRQGVLRGQMALTPSALVLQPPSEPESVRTRSPWHTALIALVGTLMLVLVYVFARAAIVYWQSRPEDAAKLRRASNALLFWRRR